MASNFLKLGIAFFAIFIFHCTSKAQLSMFMEKKKYGIKSPDGTIVIKPLYTSIRPVNGHSKLIIVSIGKNYGIINVKEEVVIPIVYQDIKLVDKDIVSILRANKYGLMTVEGKEIVAPTYSRMGREFSSGYIPTALDSKWGFLDKEGNIAVPFEYDYTGEFEDGYATVTLKKKQGVMNDSRQIIVPIKFDHVRIETSKGMFSHYFITENVGLKGLYATFFKTDASSSNSDDSNDFFANMITFEIKEVCAPKYNSISSAGDGIWEITLNDLEGRMNSEGKEIIAPMYKSIQALEKGYFSVSMEDHNVFSKNPTGMQPDGLVSPTGVLLTELKYHTIGGGTHGLFDVRDFKNYQYGVIDTLGKVVIPCEYRNIRAIRSDLIVATKHKAPTTAAESIESATSDNGLDGVLNRQNKQLIPFIYPWIQLSKNNFVIAQDEKYKMGILSLKNEILLPFEYNKLALNPSGEYILAKKGDKKTLFTENGTLVNIKNYDDIEWFGKDKCLFLENGKIGIIDGKGKIIQTAKFDAFDDNTEYDQYEYSKIVINDKVGFVNKDGEISIECQFEEATQFKDGFANVVLDGQKKKINSKGEIIK